MCRLFGLNSANQPVHLDYWLEAAPDSVAVQGERNPDGTGIGWFDKNHHPHIDKAAEAADIDKRFTRDAQAVDTSLVLTHVRMTMLPSGSKGGLGADHLLVDTHPFLFDGRLMAHNGGFGRLDLVDARLRPEYLDQVKGHTDSERYAALIAQETKDHDGDVAAGIQAAATWLSQNVPLYSLNTIVIGDGQLWALRYPDQRSLHVTRRLIAKGSGGPAENWQAQTTGTHHTIKSDEDVAGVIVASERIDGSDDWRLLAAGELVHVARDLATHSHIAVTEPPRELHVPAEHDPNDDTD